MDNNTEKKNRRKIPLLIFIIGCSLLVAAGAVFAFFSGGRKGAASSAAFSDLARQLSASGDNEITVSEDVSVSGLMFVNGNKTLSGDGTLTVSGDIGEYIIVINDGASLTINGVTLDGAGNAANGIYVSPGAGFSFPKGSITNLRGHGVRVLGKADIAGGTISNAGTNWLMVDEGASVSISAADFSGCSDAGILTALGSNVSLGKDVKLSDSNSYLVYNAGTMDVSGGSYTGSGNYTFHNEGSLVINGTDFIGAGALGYIENESASSAEIHGGSMTDSKADFIFNKGDVLIDGVVMDGCKSTAIESRGSGSSLTMINCAMDNIGKNAILSKTGTVKLENLSIGECGGCGIHSRGTELSGKGVSIASAGDIAVYNNSVSDSDSTVGNLSLDGFEIGTAKSYCIRTNGGEMLLSNGTVGKGDSYGLYVKNGTVVTDHVDFLGTNDPDRSVVQVGLSKTPAGHLTFNDTTVTGGAKGVTNHGEFVFNSGKIYGNKSTGKATGAGVYNSGTFTMNGGTISGNTSAGSGGGLSNSKGTATINGGSISGNSSNKYGGGVYNSGTLTVYGGNISGNYALSGGGGAENTGSAYFYGGSVSDNSSGNGGGGIYIGSKGVTTLSGVVVSGNKTSNGKSGGGVSVNGGRCNIYAGTRITGNYSESNGGGVYNYGYLYIAGGKISNNTAVKNGGGIANSSFTGDSGKKYTGSLVIMNADVSGNLCRKSGGGVYNAASMDIKGGTFSKNHATENGGGIAVTSEALISGCGITDNLSDANGGGLYVSGKGDVTLEQMNIYRNKACSGCTGAGLFNEGATEVLTGCVFSENGDSTSKGGGVYNSGTLSLASGTVVYLNNGKAKMANICNNGTLTLLGKQHLVETYLMTGAYFTLDSALESGSRVEVSMETFEFGELVLSGSSSDIAATVDSIVLLDNEGRSDEEKLSIEADSGILKGGEVEGDEASIVDENGEVIISGTLKEMLAASKNYSAESHSIKLQRNCVVSEKLSSETAINIDGDGKTIIFSGSASGLVLSGEGNKVKNLSIKTSTELSSSALSVSSGASAEITDCSFKSCRSSANGAAINNQGTLTISGCSFEGCETSSQYGGAVYNGKAITIIDSSFSNNSAKGDSSYGGSVYMKKDSTSVIKKITASGGSAKYGADFYTNGSCEISELISIDAFHLATGRHLTLTGELDDGSAIGVKVSSANFKSGTTIIEASSGSEGYLADATEKITLLNDPDSETGIYLGTNGVLVNGGEAELLRSGSRVKVGSIAEILKAAESGDTVRLISNASLSEAVSIGYDITLTSKSKDYTLSFDTAGSSISFTSGSAAVQDINLKSTISGRTASLLTASGASLTLSGVTVDYASSSGAYAVDASGCASANVSNCVFKDTAGQSVSNRALHCGEDTALTMSGASFKNGLGFSVGSVFDVKSVNLSGSFDFGCEPAEDSMVSVTYETFAAGTTVYTWSYEAGSTADEIEAAFNNHYTVSNKVTGGLGIIPVIDSKAAILKADIEAELYKSGKTKPGKFGSLVDMLAEAESGDTVKLVTTGIVSSAVSVSKDITFDGNSKEIILTASDGGITVSSKKATFDNVSVKSGTTLSVSAITVSSGVKLICNDCNINGISSSNSGAAINNAGTLIMNGCQIKDCSSSKTGTGMGGGAIFNAGKAEITDCVLSNNYSANYGGAIYNKKDCALKLTNTQASGNSSAKTGGDVYNNGELVVEGSIRVDDLYLYNNHYITTAGIASGSSMTVTIQDSCFVAGTVVVAAEDSLSAEEASTALVETVKAITLGNNEGKAASEIVYTLHKSGVLICENEAELITGDGSVTGRFSYLLSCLNAGTLQGSEIKLLADAFVDSSANIPDGITINGNNKTLNLSGETLTIVGSCTVKDASVSSGKIINNGTAIISGTEFNSCNVLSDSDITLSTTVFNAGSCLTVSGTVKADISSVDAVVAGELSEDSSIGITAASYEEGSVIVKAKEGFSEDTLGTYISDGKIVLKNNDGIEIPMLLLGDGTGDKDNTGILIKNPAADAEAYIFDNGTCTNNGSFADMWSQVKAGQTITLNNDVTLDTDLINSKNITLNLNNHTLTGTGTATVIKNNSKVSLTIKNGTIAMPTGASFTGSGGGIYNAGTLNLSGVTISGCYAGSNGGGLYNSGTATLTSVTITGCKAIGNGGAIYSYSSGTAKMTVNSLVTSDNTDKSNRCIYFATGSSATISGGTIGDNVYVYAAKDKTATLTISGGTFNGTIDKSGAGAVITIEGGSFTNDPTKYVDTDEYTVMTPAESGTGYYVVTDSALTAGLAEEEAENPDTEEAAEQTEEVSDDTAEEAEEAEEADEEAVEEDEEDTDEEPVDDEEEPEAEEPEDEQIAAGTAAVSKKDTETKDNHPSAAQSDGDSLNAAPEAAEVNSVPGEEAE